MIVGTRHVHLFVIHNVQLGGSITNSFESTEVGSSRSPESGFDAQQAELGYKFWFWVF